ncbi:MAG: serine hydrolase domain-containing protein [Rhodanobacteraceae bacterium]
MRVLFVFMLLLFSPVLFAGAPVQPDMSRQQATQRLQRFVSSVGENPGADFVPVVRAQFTPDFIASSGAERLAKMLKRMSNDGFGHLESIDKVRWQPDKARWAYSVHNADGDPATLYFKYDPAQGRRISDVRIIMGERLPVPKVAEAQFADTILAHLKKTPDFSGTVVVAKDGKPIVSYAAGLADRASGRAMTPDTPINLGSVNKMFTGTLVAQLVEAGKLHWADKVGKYLPDYPNKTVRDQVTLAMLMTHTSGVPSYWNATYEKRRKHLRNQQDYLDTFDRQPLEFPPGTQWAYSNGGPVILGRILEVVTGENYYDYVREHLYRPLGMTHTDSYRRDMGNPPFAIGYMRPEGAGPEASLVPNSNWLGVVGSAAGGGYASAPDMLKFVMALQDGSLLKPATLAMMWADTRVGGHSTGYGYLVGTGKLNGHRRIGHSGGAPGVNAMVHFFPDDGYAVIVLSNHERGAQQLAAWIEELITRNL